MNMMNWEKMFRRVNGTITDILQMTDTCRKDLMGTRNVKSASNQGSDFESSDSSHRLKK